MVDFEALYQKYCIEPMNQFGQLLGHPVDLPDDAYHLFLRNLKDPKNLMPDNSFYLVVDIRKEHFELIHGMQKSLGITANTLKAFLQLIHPDYLEPYLVWSIASYKTSFDLRSIVKPLQQSYRITLPLKRHDGQYYWYSYHATALRIDANGMLITHLNSYYYEGKWSEDNLRPFEASVSHKNEPNPAWERQLRAYMTDYVLDKFTNTEIDLMKIYARTGDNARTIAKKNKRWAVSTILGYNKQILAKGNKLFNCRFPDAKSVANYCTRKHYLTID